MTEFRLIWFSENELIISQLLMATIHGPNARQVNMEELKAQSTQKISYFI
jgi:hypothetical protein